MVITFLLEASWNVMANAKKTEFVFRRNGRVHLNRRGGRQFSRVLAAEVCARAVVMLDTPCSEVVWRVLATHSIRQVPLHFPSHASPCVITFQLESTYEFVWKLRSLSIIRCLNSLCVSSDNHRWSSIIQFRKYMLMGRYLGGLSLSNFLPSPRLFTRTSVRLSEWRKRFPEPNFNFR